MNICFCWRKHSLKVSLYFIKILLMNRRPIDQSRCQAPPPETKSDNPHVKFGKLSGYPFSDVPDCSLAHSHWHQHCHEDTKVIIIVIIVIILMLPSESILTPPAYAVRLEPIYLLEGAIKKISVFGSNLVSIIFFEEPPAIRDFCFYHLLELKKRWEVATTNPKTNKTNKQTNSISKGCYRICLFNSHECQIEILLCWVRSTVCTLVDLAVA